MRELYEQRTKRMGTHLAGGVVYGIQVRGELIR